MSPCVSLMPDNSDNIRKLFQIMDTETFPEYPLHYPPPAGWADSNDQGTILRAWRNAVKKHDQDFVLYVHVPFCEGICGFCGFFAQKLKKPQDIPSYLKMLRKEASLYSPIFQSRSIMWLCVGGGTPSIMSSEQIRDFFGIMRDNFNLAENVRIAFESHPDTLDAAKMRTLKQCGGDWLAIGVQSLDDEVLKKNRRVQDNSRLPGLVAGARKAGIRNIQIDLIAGLPFQTRESFLKDVDAMSRLKPERIYLFPFQRKERVPLRNSAPPEPDWLWEGYRQAVNKLGAAGYELSCGRWVYKGSGGNWPYSYDQGEKPTTNFYSILGLGPGAISYVRDGARYQNSLSFAAYRRSLDQNRLPVAKQISLSLKDEMINFVILNLLHKGSCSKKEFKQVFNRDIDGVFKIPLTSLMEQGRIQCLHGEYYLRDRASGLFHVRKEFFEPELLKRLLKKYSARIAGLPSSSKDAGAAPLAPQVPEPPASAGSVHDGHQPKVNYLDPHTFECHLDYSCNAKCLFCYNTVNSGRIDFAGAGKQLFSERRELGKTSVVFSGGEPVLYDELPGLIGLARKLGYQTISISTNGVKLKDRNYFKGLVWHGLNKVELSVHAPYEELHDKLVGLPGAWRAVQKALYNAKEFEINVRINCVVNRLNSGVLADIVRVFRGQHSLKDFRFILIKNPGMPKIKEANLSLGWREAAKALKPVFDVMEEKDHMTLLNLPACVKPEWVEYMEDLVPASAGTAPQAARVSESLTPTGTGARLEPGVFQSPQADNRIKPKACRECSLQMNCPGVDGGYLELYGNEEIRPVRALR